MLTVRQIEKLWAGRAYGRLFRELLAARPEASARLEVALARAAPAAALTVIRLDELSQSHVPLVGRLIRTLLAAQERDGGWGDAMTTALCVRALRCGAGGGAAIEAGLNYLADLQKSEGVWPKEPIRRMPADAFGSAFVLFQLGGDRRFRSAVRFTDAVAWFERHESALDPEARRLWDHARLRCRRSTHLAAPVLWS